MHAQLRIQSQKVSQDRSKNRAGERHGRAHAQRSVRKQEISRKADFAKASGVAKAMADKSSARDAKAPRKILNGRSEQQALDRYQSCSPSLPLLTSV